jgi:hypothetical protein
MGSSANRAKIATGNVIASYESIKECQPSSHPEISM